MGDCIISRRGGGTGKAFAVINVTYPSGSTCTCTKGTKTLRSKAINGQWNFLVPEAGTWTVTITDGDKTKTLNVSITTAGQVEIVSLTYEYVLFPNGVTFSQGMGSITPTINETEIYVRSSYNAYSESGSACSVVTDNKVDLTDFTKLCARVTSYSGSVPTGAFVHHTRTANVWAGSLEARGEISAVGTIIVDISSLTGEHYVGVCPSFHGGTNYVYFDRIWLE